MKAWKGVCACVPGNIHAHVNKSEEILHLNMASRNENNSRVQGAIKR